MTPERAFWRGAVACPAGSEGGPMNESGHGAVQRMFEHLAAYDWEAFRALLSPNVERIGPFGERLVGRDAYVELMAGDWRDASDPRPRTTWDLHRVAYSADRRSAFARVTAHVSQDDRDLQIDQTLVYDLDEDGLISRIEVFWRHPRP
jgi:hypothetical protein